MAKIFGISGKIQGKIANQVFAIVKGVNMARAYNPSPANPQTTLQVAQRAKLKLISQVAAAFAPAIAFPRIGLSSPRNQFTKGNIAKITYDTQTETATMDYSAVDLTGGLVGLPNVNAVRQSSRLVVSLSEAVANIDVMFYTVVIVMPNAAVRLVGPIRVDKTGALDGFEQTISGVPASAQGYVLAYGMRFNNDDARAKYGSAQFVGADVNVLVIRQLLENNVTFTETKSTEIPASE